MMWWYIFAIGILIVSALLIGRAKRQRKSAVKEMRDHVRRLAYHDNQ